MSPRATIELQKPHEAQYTIKNEARRYNVLDCGRRFGKTMLGVDLTCEPVLKGYPVGWYSPIYKDTAEVWRDLKRIYAPVTRKKLETEKRLELVSGGVIDMWSLEDPDSSRGRKYRRIIVDEAAKIKKLEQAWTETIRPTLADFEGDAFFLSTPKGLNYFHNLWVRAGKGGNWSRWQYPTSANPFISQSEIDAMRSELPERVFRQEILAEFIEDGAYFQNIDEAAVIAERDTPDNHVGHRIVMAVDWAITNDFSVFGAACCDCNRVVDWDRFNMLDFTIQRERLYTMARRWNVKGCLPERNSIGLPNIEIIREHVPILRGPDGKLGFQTTATTKPILIQGLASALEHKGFLVPVESADELRVYEVTITTSANIKFGAPQGLNDDWVIMLALLWRSMTIPTGVDLIALV